MAATTLLCVLRRPVRPSELAVGQWGSCGQEKRERTSINSWLAIGSKKLELELSFESFLLRELWCASNFSGPTSSQLLTFFGTHVRCAPAREHMERPPPSQRDFGQDLGQRRGFEAEDA